jgi:hypothetical protein
MTGGGKGQRESFTGTEEITADPKMRVAHPSPNAVESINNYWLIRSKSPR